MAATITLGATTLHPLQVLGYNSRRQSGNKVHPVLNRESPDVAFISPSLRSGTLRLLFGNETDALAAEDLHCTVGVFVLADTDMPGVGMNYVPSGAIEKSLDEESSKLWVVSVEFEEVAA